MSYVLAMYDVRGKQNFIYSSTHLKEIIGASAIIRDVFEDYLYPAARQYRNSLTDEKGNPVYAGDRSAEAIYDYKGRSDPHGKADASAEEEFSFAGFTDRMSTSQYLGEVVYNGGGNFLVLYRDEDVCREINYLFTKSVLEHIGTLRVLCTWVPVTGNGENYSNAGTHDGDYQKLYEKHRIHQDAESFVYPYGTLPVVQTSYDSSMPLTTYVWTSERNSHPDKATTESAAKYAKYKREKDAGKAAGDAHLNEEVLDRMVRDKGTDSLLAIVYIDGNNMGAHVQNLLTGGDTSYDYCVNRLRAFSGEIQKKLIDAPIDRIDAVLKKKYGDSPDESYKRRIPIYAGDEITVICNAHDAFKIAETYLSDLPQGKEESEKYSSCAGISIFHSHAPYTDAYRIAEECCDSAKAYMKAHDIQNACLMDYHYNQGVIGISLDEIRKHDNDEDLSLPWVMVRHDDAASGKPASVALNAKPSLDEVKRTARLLKEIGHSNVKGLLESAGNGTLDFRMDVSRIIAHLPEGKKELKEKLKEVISGPSIEEKRKLFYDVIRVYDLWMEGMEDDDDQAQNN